MLESPLGIFLQKQHGMPIFTVLVPFRRQLRAFALSAGLAVLAVAPAGATTLEDASRLLKAGQHAEALRQIDRFLASRPQDAQGRFLKGVILVELNRQNDAIILFQRLAQDHPELPEPHNNLAVIYAQKRQYEKAKEHLEKAIRTHPAYATAHENLGDIYARLASQAYGKALQINAANASAQTKLAMIDNLVGAAKVGPGGTATAGSVANTAAATAVTPAPTPVTPPPPPPTTAAVAPPTPTIVASAPPRVAETPPPAPAATPAGAEGEVTAAVDAWLAAWSRKDAKGYLSHYARDFQTPGNQARSAWEAERTQRIARPASISVTRDNLSVRMEGADKASARFRQTYRAPGFNATTTKTLVMTRQGGRWLIQQERTH